MSGSTKTSFETLVQEFCLIHNRMEERPFEITTEMIFNDSYHMHVVIGHFVSHIKKKWGCCPSWANDRRYGNHLPLLKNAVLEQMRVSCKVTGARGKPIQFSLCNNGKQTMIRMFEMCKAMADLTPQSHAQAMLLCLKRTS